MKRILIVLSLMFMCIMSYSIVKIYCDRCKQELKRKIETFKIKITIGNKEQELSCDICDKCFIDLCKDLEKYNLKVSTQGWENSNTLPIGSHIEYQTQELDYGDTVYRWK